MNEMLSLMWLPFLACVVLIGIHAYFGIHVLKREIIFVDLALAQIAALGATVAFLFGIDPESSRAYVFSLVFVAAAAMVFALTRTRQQKVPQEAIIGIVYAVATAAAILVADRSPHGAEHIKEMLTGSLLWVSPKDVALDAGVYAAVGLFHLFCRRQFAAISEGLAEAQAAGVVVWLWDFLFYTSFGLVVSLSVRVAGVLLVFCFLIVPAVISVLFTEHTGKRLLLGWSLGTFVSLLGLLFSWAFDYPSGPAVACFFGLALLTSAAVRYGGGLLDRKRETWGEAAVNTTKVTGATSVLVAAFLLVFLPTLKRAPAGATAATGDSHVAAHTHGSQSTVDAAALIASLTAADAEGRQHAAAQIADRKIRRALPILTQRLFEVDDDQVRSALADALVKLGDRAVAVKLRTKLHEQDSPAAVVAVSTVCLGLGDNSAIPLLIGLLKDDAMETIKYRQAALELLKSRANNDFGYDALGDAASNAQPMEKWEAWWEARKEGAGR